MRFSILAEGATQTHSWILPETYEIVFGLMASGLVFGLLFKFAGPTVVKSMAARTAKIQAELDSGTDDLASAHDEAARIRQAKGDIGAERERILAVADEQAAVVLSDGRARLQQELVDMRTRGAADIAAAASRTGDELRAEISRLSSAAVDHVVSGSLDSATHQELIESFIARIGASL